MNQQSRQDGFTFIELLVTLTILVLIVGFSVGGFRDFARFQEHSQAVSEVSYLLQGAQTDARSALADSSYGVHIEPSSVTYFIGDSYSVGDPSNEVTSYQNVVFSTDLSDGSDTIHFARLTGLASATGTITVVGTAYEATSTITITKAGIIE